MVQRLTGRGSGSPWANIGGSPGSATAGSSSSSGSAIGGSSSSSGSGSGSDSGLCGSDFCFQSVVLQSSGCCTALDFASESTFGEIASADAVGMLLEQGHNLLNAPAAAEIVPDDGVKSVAAVGAGRGAFPHNLLDCINAVLRRRSRSDDGARWLGPAELLLMQLRPDNGTIKQCIDRAELLALAELQPGYCQRLASPPEELQRPGVEFEFAVQLLAVGSAPDAQAKAGGADLDIAVVGLVKQALRPGLDGAGHRIPHVVDVNSGEGILWRQHVGDAIAGCCRCYRGFIRAPAARIGGAGKPMRIIAANAVWSNDRRARSAARLPTAVACAVAPAQAAGWRSRLAVW